MEEVKEKEEESVLIEQEQALLMEEQRALYEAVSHTYKYRYYL